MEHLPKPDSHQVNRRELRMSFLLPVGAILLIWLVGVVVFMLFPPTVFTAVTSLIIALTLVVVLVYQTRQANGRLQAVAVLIAMPALIGIAGGIGRGQLGPIFIGAAVSFGLLSLQKFLTTPLSYRQAVRYFRMGDSERATMMINKSLEQRPDYAPSYQLRAILYLTETDFPRAERDGRFALQYAPQSDAAHNVLAQIYLAQNLFDKAKESLATAVRLDPNNPLYRYHLGYALYHLGDDRAAAEQLAFASKGPFPAVEYDLWVHYFLGCSLERLLEPTAAAEAFAKMAKFQSDFAELHEQIELLPAYPQKELLLVAAEDMKKRLNLEEARAKSATNG